MSETGAGEAGDRRAALLCAFLGLATLGVFIGFQMLPPVRAAMESGCADGEAMAHFQMARTMADLVGVFSAPNGECRATMIAAMDALNKLDIFLFVPAYAGFLAAAVWMIAGDLRAPLALVAVGAAALAALGDVLETATQLRITRNIEGAGGLIAPLAIGFWLKYAGIAFHGVVLAALAFVQTRKRWVVIGLGIALGLAALAAAADLQRAIWMTRAIAIFWAALLAGAILTLTGHKARGVRPEILAP
ncbi:MAG: hypothetical protein AB7O04_09685 [Hyphomonadaceae bacterium]